MFTRNEEIAFQKGYKILENDNIQNPKGNLIKGNKTTNGYLEFKIRKSSNSWIRVSVHRLQAYQKFGDKIYNDKIQVRHLNCNSADNSLENIGIGSSKENKLDVPEEIRKESAKNANKKYSDELIQNVIKDRLGGLTRKEIVEKYSLDNEKKVTYIVNRYS